MPITEADPGNAADKAVLPSGFDAPDPQFDATTARLLRREALRRAAEELNTTSGPGLEDMLARISAEVTAEATGARVGNENRARTDAKSSPEPSSGPAGDLHGA